MGKATVVGGFVLGALAIGVAAILLFGGASLFTSNVRAVVYFPDSIAGLSTGSPVTFRGVRIGTVQSMKIEVRMPEQVPVIPVYLELEQARVSWNRGSGGMDAGDVNQAVNAGLRAQLSTQSLVTGQLSVDLDFYPDTPSVMVGGGSGVPEIPSVPSNLQRLKTQLADLNLPDLAETARLALVGILHIVNELDGKVGPMAESLRATSDAARVALESATASVQRLQTDASRTLGKIETLAGTGDAWIAGMRGDFDRLLATADRTVAQANRLANSLNDIAAPRSAIRGDLEATMRDLAAAASSLRDFARELERNPSGTLLRR